MNIAAMPSTEELAAAAGVTTNTILRWKTRGLFHGLEKPAKPGGPRRGVRLRWPDAALARVREIVRLQGEGKTTAELQQHFGANAAEYAAAKKTVAPNAKGPREAP